MATTTLYDKTVKATDLSSVSSLGDNDILIVHTDGGLKKMTYSNLKTELLADTNALLAPLATNAAARHNAIWRGKFLGKAITDAQNTAIKNGTFEDLYLGDYWTIGGIDHVIVHFDYWLNTGDTETTAHHVVCVPRTIIGTAKMNETNTTEGGYIGSDMYKNGLTAARDKLASIFGSHLLSKRSLFTNAVTNGVPSADAWFDSTVDLMNERMVYGANAFTPANTGGNTVTDLYTESNTILAGFLFSKTLQGASRHWYW